MPGASSCCRQSPLRRTPLAVFHPPIFPDIHRSTFYYCSSVTAMTTSSPPAHWHVERSRPPSSIMVKGLILTSHYIRVPLDYSGRIPGTIEVFAREVSLPPPPFHRGAAAPPISVAIQEQQEQLAVATAVVRHSGGDDDRRIDVDGNVVNGDHITSGRGLIEEHEQQRHHRHHHQYQHQIPTSNLPYIVYLQGGPGHESPRPTEPSGFIRKLLLEYRVLLLDQRGTGLSHGLSCEVLSSLPKSHRLQYIQCFRANSIVRDAEQFRHILSPQQPWSILGQSFGGFCALSYLSLYPNSLRETYITGGLPLITPGCSAGDVYRALITKVIRQNDLYYSTFPADLPIIHSIVLYLNERWRKFKSPVLLPSGSILTPRLFQAIGLSLLGFSGGFSRLHFLLERAWDTPDPTTGERHLAFTFLKSIDSLLSFDTNPLYALLHEAIYCNGHSESSKWSAMQVLSHSKYSKLFDAVDASMNGQRVYFTGEMIFPWMFDDIAALRPLKDFAEEIANHKEWSLLYNEHILNNLPKGTCAAAVIYVNDMYVDYDLSMKTAQNIPQLKYWITSEYMHCGLREDGANVIGRLSSMMRGKVALEN